MTILMERLVPALLLCLSLQALGADRYLSGPIDVVGTPLQQGFKDLYREVHRAETEGVGDMLFKSVSAGWRNRAEEFLEHTDFATHHPCEEVEVWSEKRT